MSEKKVPQGFSTVRQTSSNPSQPPRGLQQGASSAQGRCTRAQAMSLCMIQEQQVLSSHGFYWKKKIHFFLTLKWPSDNWNTNKVEENGKKDKRTHSNTVIDKIFSFQSQKKRGSCNIMFIFSINRDEGWCDFFFFQNWGFSFSLQENNRV